MKIGDSPPIGRFAAEGKVQRQGSPTEQIISAAPSLPQGRLIKGTVLSVNADGQTVILADGKTLSAQSLVPLEVGQKLWFEVLREGEPPLLGLAGKNGAVVDLMRLLFSFAPAGEVSPEGNIANKLAAALQSANPKLASEVEHFLKLYSEGAIDAESDPVKVLKISLALGFFAKRQHLSGDNKLSQHQLVDFLSSLSQQGKGSVVEMAEGNKGLAHLLKLFDSFAQLNSQPVAQDQHNFFLFPCFFSGESGWGEWLFRFAKEGKSGDESGGKYGLSFFLEMSNLGELHFQVYLRGNSLQGVFSVLDEGGSRHLLENLDELSLTLKDLGFHPVNLSCQLAQAKNMHRLKEELTELAGKELFALVDVTI